MSDRSLSSTDNTLHYSVCIRLSRAHQTAFIMAENHLANILKRDKLGGKNVAKNKINETKQSFYRPSGEIKEMPLSEAIAEFMNENYPEFGEKSVSFPEQAVDFGLST